MCSGRAQFVGDVGGQVAALLLGAFQFGHHVVEATRQVPQRAALPFAQAHAQVALGDGIGGRHDVGEGRAQTAESQPAQDEGNQRESQWHAAQRDQ